MRFSDFLEPNLLRGMVPLQSQQTFETTAPEVTGDLNLAKALTLSGNMNCVAGQGTCDLNRLRTATLIDSQNPGRLGSFNLQFHLGSDEIPRRLFYVNV